MSTRDIRSDLAGQLVFNANITSSTTTTGQIFDTADYDGGIKLDFICSAYTDGTYTPIVYESDDSGMSGANAVADTNLIGTEAGCVLSAVTATTTSPVPSLGLIGTKRYIRVSIVSATVTTGARIHVIAQKKPEVLVVSGLSA